VEPKTTSSTLIALGLFSLPDQGKLRMLKTHRSRRPIHPRFLHPSSHHLLHHTTPLSRKNTPFQVTGRQNLRRLPLFGTSFVLLSRGKDRKVALPTRMGTFSHLPANIDSRCPTSCLRVHNDHCTFSRREVGGPLHSIHLTASILHPPTNPLSPSTPSPQDGLVHQLRALCQTVHGHCVRH
jgi:hypothetical protein